MFFGCPSVMYVLTIFVSTIFHKLLEDILPNLQFWCTWEQRWTD